MEPRQTDEMFEQFRDTKAIIFDMRGYPRGTAWSIAPRLTEKSNIPVALFRRQEVLTPKYGFGELATTVTRTESTQVIAPSNQWKYKGKTVMLINQDAVSQSEHTGLIFRAMANTVFIGTPTAGANGDVTSFIIPGGITLGFSGQGVWWPDGSQLQRKGLQPDILVNPTIKGLIEGKDEILDKALESLIGNSSPSGKE
jgi:C-terminal processing protease CtpA/Prc